MEVETVQTKAQSYLESKFIARPVGASVGEWGGGDTKLGEAWVGVDLPWAAGEAGAEYHFLCPQKTVHASSGWCRDSVNGPGKAKLC